MPSPIVAPLSFFELSALLLLPPPFFFLSLLPFVPKYSSAVSLYLEKIHETAVKSLESKASVIGVKIPEEFN